MKPRHSLIACLTVFVALILPALASAQLPWRLFGTKAPEKGATAKGPALDLRRVTEINVEIAWLADPLTFPYYLEAHVISAQHLDVRGYVPNKAVRDHALRIAQVHSSLPVIDSMKEHPSLLVRPSQMSPQQLQSSVLASLRVALPKQSQQFKVECGADGKVRVSGLVATYDEKIAVSHSLRRLHGCTSVQNLTAVPDEIARTIAGPPRDNNTAKGTLNEPPLIDTQKKSDGPTLVGGNKSGNDAPVLIPPVAKDNGPDLGVKEPPEVIKVELPIKGIGASELEKRIREACPKAINVEASMTSATDLRILIETRTAADVSPIADRILAMPELKSLRPELQFKISPR